MAEKTLLLVDDDALIRRSLSTVLRLDGYDVLEAASGAEALQVLDRATPDLVITDFNMPVLNGMQLLREIQTRKP